MGKKLTAGTDISQKLFPSFDLPGIQISRIETLDFDDGSVYGSKRYIIIQSDYSSDFSQLSFTSENSLSAGSRGSRSRSSRASSNTSSRLWDFSPRESEWDADVSVGSRESQLSVSRQDWSGGPSHGSCRDYSLLSPYMPRKSSVVTFDMGEAPRRHSSPASSIRRKFSNGGNGQESLNSPPANDTRRRSTTAHTSLQTLLHPHSSGTTPVPQLLALRMPGPRILDDYRTLNQFRKRSCGDQSIMSVRIEEGDDDDEKDDDDDDNETTPLTSKEDTTTEEQSSSNNAEPSMLASGSNDELKLLQLLQQQRQGIPGPVRSLVDRRRASLKRNTTDDSEVERRVARILHEIEYSLTDSVDESKIHSHSSGDTLVVKVEAQTQTLSVQELDQLTQQQQLGQQLQQQLGQLGQATDSSTGSSTNTDKSTTGTESTGSTEKSAVAPATPDRSEPTKSSKFRLLSRAIPRALFTSPTGGERSMNAPANTGAVIELPGRRRKRKSSAACAVGPSEKQIGV